MAFDSIGKTDEKGHLDVFRETRRVLYLSGETHERYVECDKDVWIRHAYDLSSLTWQFVGYETERDVKRDVVAHSDWGDRVRQINFGSGESVERWLGI
jgi:hypothetical protein